LETLRGYALQAWAQEQEKRKQSEYKKRKRKAKKIEDAIEELLPKDTVVYQVERHMEDPEFTVVVIVTDESGSLRFTQNDKGDLVLIGKCPNSDREVLSAAIDDAADLGKLIENFVPADPQNCQ
jgi:hypothetical protein